MDQQLQLLLDDLSFSTSTREVCFIRKRGSHRGNFYLGDEMKSVSTFCLLLLLCITGAIPAGAEPALVYSTGLGGAGVDVAVDSAGNAIVLGNGGSQDYFLAKLSPRGELIFRRPVELPSEPSMNARVLSAVALDPAGYIYIAGTVSFNNCYGEDPYECMANDSHLGFVAKLGPDGTGLSYYTIYWEAHASPARDLAVDALGRAHVLVTITWREYDYPFSDGIRFSPAGSVESYFGSSSYLYWTDGPTAMAMGPSGDLFAVGWGYEDYEGYSTAAYLQRTDASGTVITALFGNNEMIEPVDVAGAPGGGSAVVARKSEGLYVAEFSPAGETIFSRVLNLGMVETLDVAVTSFGQIVLVVNTGPSSLLLWLEGGTGEVISSTSFGDRAYAGALAAGPWGDVYMARNGYVSRYTENRPPVCSGATASPSTIWPPDRRQVRISTLGVTDPDGDPITLKVTRILQDELFTARMSDAGSVGTAKPWVRADRMDNGDGRVYHLFFEATDPSGAKCTGEVKVCVPIQSGGTCRDGGARFDSTLPR